MGFTHWCNFHFHSLSGCPLNAQAIKKGKVSEELMTIKVKASGGRRTGQGHDPQGLAPQGAHIQTLLHAGGDIWRGKKDASLKFELSYNFL